MKKILNTVAVCAMLVVSVFALAACGGGSTLEWEVLTLDEMKALVVGFDSDDFLEGSKSFDMYAYAKYKDDYSDAGHIETDLTVLMNTDGEVAQYYAETLSDVDYDQGMGDYLAYGVQVGDDYDEYLVDFTYEEKDIYVTDCVYDYDYVATEMLFWANRSMEFIMFDDYANLDAVDAQDMVFYTCMDGENTLIKVVESYNGMSFEVVATIADNEVVSIKSYVYNTTLEADYEEDDINLNINININTYNYDEIYLPYEFDDCDKPNWEGSF
jgi:hypothetical protein